jgi:hypothetical protein
VLAAPDAQTLKKKAFPHTLEPKKCLRKRAGVLFFAPIDIRSAAQPAKPRPKWPWQFRGGQLSAAS